MRLWVVRAGEKLAYWAVFREQSIVGINFDWRPDMPDLLTADRPTIGAMVRQIEPGRTAASAVSVASQTWSFVHEIRVDDQILVPTQRGHAFSLCRVVSDVELAQADSPLRLIRHVAWTTHDVAATGLVEDLRNSLGSIQAVFSPRAPGALERIVAVAAGGHDPGPTEYAPDVRTVAWVFQCDPARYDLLDAIAHRGEDVWAMNQHRAEVEIGSRVWFRTTRPTPGVVATARIASLPRKREETSEFGTWVVDVTYESLVEPPLTQADVDADHTLSVERALSGVIGTNFPLPESLDLYLAEILADRLRPVPVTIPESRRAEEGINRSIEHHRALIEAEILTSISSMSADDFETLSRLILEAVGLEDVRQTGAKWAHSLGDGGVDLEAQLSQRGFPPLRVRAQAKRQAANVGPGPVQRLRGALRAGEQGVFLTTSRFTKQAVEEAQADGKPPIGLVDGSTIAKVMIDSGLAVKTTEMAVHRFDPSHLAQLVSDPGDKAS